MGWARKDSLDQQKHLHVTRTPHVTTQHCRHRVLLAVNHPLEEGPLGTDCAVSLPLLFRDGDGTVVDDDQPLVHSTAIPITEIEPDLALHVTQQGVVTLFPQLAEETADCVGHALSPFSVLIGTGRSAAPVDGKQTSCREYVGRLRRRPVGPYLRVILKSSPALRRAKEELGP